MRNIISLVKHAYIKYPIIRGMTAFAIMWPASNGVQQMLDKTRDKIDVLEVIRFSSFGTFVVAPTVYAWAKTVAFLVPGNTLKSVITKVRFFF